MDRRDFLLRTGALLALFGGGSTVSAAEPKSKKKAKSKTPARPDPAVAPFVPGSWTLAVLPDVQKYSDYFPGVLRLQTQWIAENKARHNIAFVLQTGDLTDHNNKREWGYASQGFKLLDGVVPYTVVPGNHDYTGGGGIKDRRTAINDYFPPSRFKKMATFGGTMEEGRIENNYHLFEAGGQKWLVVGLEWGPRDAALQWAGTILDRYADRKAVILTHAYLFPDNTRHDWAKKGRNQNANPHAYSTPGSVNDGEEMWRKLVKKHANMRLVINGHMHTGGDGWGLQVSRGDHGNRVNEMLVDYQAEPIGGGGWIRLLEFLPDGKTIQAKSYSPLYDRYWTNADNQFTMTLE